MMTAPIVSARITVLEIARKWEEYRRRNQPVHADAMKGQVQ